MKEIKVRLRYIEVGQCMEMWQVEPQEGRPDRWVCRELSGLHEWSWLHGAPYDACERGWQCSNDIIFIICDKDWNPVMKDGNDRTLFPESFPTFEENCISAWNSIKENHPHVITDINEWLCQKSPKPFSNDVEKHNWAHSPEYQGTINEETLLEFDSCGQKKVVVRVTRQHKLCDARWHVYFAGNLQRKQDEGFEYCFGYEYHDS